MGNEGESRILPLNKALRFGKDADMNDMQLTHECAAKTHFTLEVVNHGRAVALVCSLCSRFSVGRIWVLTCMRAACIERFGLGSRHRRQRQPRRR